MKTSELETVLKLRNWQDFCVKYAGQRSRLLSRKDGAATSGDLQMNFDVTTTVIEKKQIIGLCKAACRNQIFPEDIYFISTLLALSGFDYDQESTEDAVYFLSTPQPLPLGVAIAEKALSML